MRCAVLGGVVSTSVLIDGLARHGFKDVRVWGYEPRDSAIVSGWTDLRVSSGEAGFQYEGFRKVAECAEGLRWFEPDVLFVVGLSQLVPSSILSIAKRANVGFHPTQLPKGRGRAPVAWLILEQMAGAATFFSLREGVDDGPIFVQIPFQLDSDDDAESVYRKVLDAEAEALDRWLPRLKSGDLYAVEQEHAEASWFGRRAPEDGFVDWARPRSEILRLIRASAPPHPGAYCFSGDARIVLLAARLQERREQGVTGRVLATHADGSFDVQAADGLMRVTKWATESQWEPRVGIRLAYYTEAEVFQLKSRVSILEEKISELEFRLKQKANGN